VSILTLKLLTLVLVCGLRCFEGRCLQLLALHRSLITLGKLDLVGQVPLSCLQLLVELACFFLETLLCLFEFLRVSLFKHFHRLLLLPFELFLLLFQLLLLLANLLALRLKHRLDVLQLLHDLVIQSDTLLLFVA